MQLSPSTSPIDPNFALLPGSASPVATSAGTDGIVSFEKFLPGADGIVVNPNPAVTDGSPQTPLGVQAPIGAKCMTPLSRLTNGKTLPGDEEVVGAEELSESPVEGKAETVGKKGSSGIDSKSRGTSGRPARNKDGANADTATTVPPTFVPEMLPPPPVVVASEPSLDNEAEASPKEAVVDDVLAGDEHSAGQEGQGETDGTRLGAKQRGAREARRGDSAQLAAMDEPVDQAGADFSVKGQDDRDTREVGVGASTPNSEPPVFAGKFVPGAQRSFAVHAAAADNVGGEVSERPSSRRGLARPDFTAPTVAQSKLPFPDTPLRSEVEPRVTDYGRWFNGRLQPMTTTASVPTSMSSDLGVASGIAVPVTEAKDSAPLPLFAAPTDQPPMTNVPVAATQVVPELSPVSPQAVRRFDGRDDEAKIAATSSEFRPNFRSAKREAQKTFLSAGKEELTSQSKGLGIDAANPGALMPTHAFSTSTMSHPASDYAVVAVGASGGQQAPTAESPATPPPTATSAHQAVEAVLRAVDHASTREQHSVNLRFSVGNSDLNVRVELRADQVHTTFTTDSADLRNALSHEWQSIQNSGAERNFRIAPATFNSSEPSSSNAFSGDASSRDRQHHAARQGSEFFASPTSGFGGRAESARETVRPQSHAVAPSNSRLLHTLA